MKHCQEHAKPTCGNIISTIKPCWPIRSLKKLPVDGDNSACSDVKCQNLRFCSPHMTTLQPEFLKIFTLAGVFTNVRFQWPGAAFACGQTAKPHRKSCGFENNRIRVDRAWYTCQNLARSSRLSGYFLPTVFRTLWILTYYVFRHGVILDFELLVM